MIAQGTYGVVFKAKNSRTKEMVALKQVKLHTGTARKEGFSVNALREINILLALRHPNIVGVREMVVGSSLDKVYMVMDYFDNDLKHVLDTVPHLLSEGDKKWLMRQLLEGIAYMHDRWYLHRDLKTSNILITRQRGHLAIADLGLARTYGSPLRPYTPVVVTPGYRCPELLLGVKTYSTAVDIWSIGCIMGEVLTGKPLFRADTDIAQLEAIFKILGTPTEARWPGWSSLPNVASMMLKFQKTPHNNLRAHLYQTHQSTYSAACYDLLENLLHLDPAQRLSASAALKHEWFRETPAMTSPEHFPDLPARKHH
uniref:Cyclin-dependent kinase 2 homolog n=2 Tax=Nannochloropsis gaditana TaxID=72520 RepID=I2CPA2_NANGC